VGRLGFCAGSFVATGAGRATRNLVPRIVAFTVAVHLDQPMTVHTILPCLIMDVRRSAGLTGELRIDPPAVTGSAGLGFGATDELMAGDQAGAHPANNRTPHMTVAAGGMAVVARFREYLFCKNLFLRRGKTGTDPHFKTVGRVVQRCLVILGDGAMALAAELDIVGWPAIESLVSRLLIRGGIVAAVALHASERQMNFCQLCFVNQIAFVGLVRLHRRRGARSANPFFAGRGFKNNKLFQCRLVGMTV